MNKYYGASPAGKTPSQRKNTWKTIGIVFICVSAALTLALIGVGVGGKSSSASSGLEPQLTAAQAQITEMQSKIDSLTSENETLKADNEAYIDTLAQAKAQPEASPVVVEPEYSEPIQLSSGNYVAGVDFPAGKYDIRAIKGSGNVQSDNLLDGGINAIMGVGVEGEFADMYEEEYKNINLSDGVTLAVKGLTVELTKK